MACRAHFTMLGGRVRLHDVPPRPTEEALWLAHALISHPPAVAGPVLDAGCGCGVVGLTLLTRQYDIGEGAFCLTEPMTGVDVCPDLIAIAQENAKLNGHKLAYQSVIADFTNLPFAPHTFAAVVANLPFHAATRGHNPQDADRALAKTLPPNTLEPWLDALWRVVKPGGVLWVLLHTAECPKVSMYLQQKGLTAHSIQLQSQAGHLAKRALHGIGHPATLSTWRTFDPALRQVALG